MQSARSNDPLCARYGGVPWEPWTSDLARARFLDELKALLAQAAEAAEAGTRPDPARRQR